MTIPVRSRLAGWANGLAILVISTQVHAASLKTQNVFLIISDGLRWQEIFNGAEEKLLPKNHGGVKNVAALRAEFWRDTPEARREALFPFLWGDLARHGQLLGNQNKGSVVTVMNGHKFSYPGYNEILTGFGDSRIASNDKNPNPNVTVFEWLENQADPHGRTAVFGTWDVFPYSEGDWIAVMGPDTPPLGERVRTEAHTQSQIAATIAALFERDYRAFFPAAGAPISDILPGEPR
jgi:hypothetical protein